MSAGDTEIKVGDLVKAFFWFDTVIGLVIDVNAVGANVMLSTEEHVWFPHESLTKVSTNECS